MPYCRRETRCRNRPTPHRQLQYATPPRTSSSDSSWQTRNTQWQWRPPAPTVSHTRNGHSSSRKSHRSPVRLAPLSWCSRTRIRPRVQQRRARSMRHFHQTHKATIRRSLVVDMAHAGPVEVTVAPRPRVSSPMDIAHGEPPDACVACEKAAGDDDPLISREDDDLNDTALAEALNATVAPAPFRPPIPVGGTARSRSRPRYTVGEPSSARACACEAA
ncbi:hypothetical protein DFH09DRAFT_324353 [Mycena vulgaris]|nr:hypothetical protein DFH09DRAFT_324353 [Mycena vulgaris]